MSYAGDAMESNVVRLPPVERTQRPLVLLVRRGPHQPSHATCLGGYDPWCRIREYGECELEAFREFRPTIATSIELGKCVE